MLNESIYHYPASERGKVELKISDQCLAMWNTFRHRNAHSKKEMESDVRCSLFDLLTAVRTCTDILNNTFPSYFDYCFPSCVITDAQCLCFG